MKAAIVLLFVIIFHCSYTHLPGTMSDSNKGKEIFESKCAKCHGAYGTKGKWGAKNLQLSRISDSDMKAIIINGKRIMPAWGKRLTEDELLSVMDYVRTLRK
jgi:cytochrome c6